MCPLPEAKLLLQKGGQYQQLFLTQAELDMLDEFLDSLNPTPEPPEPVEEQAFKILVNMEPAKLLEFLQRVFIERTTTST